MDLSDECMIIGTKAHEYNLHIYSYLEFFGS